ncbi:hypothetical protein [Kitasatospora acidiphila]|nr:hypothetical protein [Kitasatospora acidiphila]
MRNAPTGEVVLSTEKTAVAIAPDEAWRLGQEIVNLSYDPREGQIH